MKKLLSYFLAIAFSAIAVSVPASALVTFDLQAAVDAASPGDTINIPVGNDVRQRVIINKPNLTINGNGATVSYSVNTNTAAAAGGNSRDRNVVKIESTATGTIIKNLTIENTAAFTNVSEQEADALAVFADGCKFENVTLESFQNTLCVGGDSEFINCTVKGLDNIIYSPAGSDSKVYFRSCTITSRFNEDKTSDNVIMRLGGSPEILFSDCNFDSEALVFPDSCTLLEYNNSSVKISFLDCVLDDAIYAEQPISDISSAPLNYNVISAYMLSVSGILNSNVPRLSVGEAAALRERFAAYFTPEEPEDTIDTSIPPHLIPQKIPDGYVPVYPTITAVYEETVNMDVTAILNSAGGVNSYKTRIEIIKAERTKGVTQITLILPEDCIGISTAAIQKLVKAAGDKKLFLVYDGVTMRLTSKTKQILTKLYSTPLS
jgi:hypothetical protein